MSIHAFMKLKEENNTMLTAEKINELQNYVWKCTKLLFKGALICRIVQDKINQKNSFFFTESLHLRPTSIFQLTKCLCKV